MIETVKVEKEVINEDKDCEVKNETEGEEKNPVTRRTRHKASYSWQHK
jgi:hypothetical protein